MLLIKLKIFNIFIDFFSSLNIFSTLLSHLLQILGKSNVFSKMCDILGFLNFLYLSKPHNRFFHLNLFRTYWKYLSIILSFLSQSLGENKLVYFKKFIIFHINSINPIQKYPHTIKSTESYACILAIFAVIFLLPINFLIYFGIRSTLKLSKHVTLSPFT